MKSSTRVLVACTLLLLLGAPASVARAVRSIKAAAPTTQSSLGIGAGDYAAYGTGTGLHAERSRRGPPTS